MKINDILSDEELEECIDGCTELSLIRNLIERTQDGTLLDVEKFSKEFAYQISGFNNFDPVDEKEEWLECNQNNEEWGESIAESINDMVFDKWVK